MTTLFVALLILILIALAVILFYFFRIAFPTFFGGAIYVPSRDGAMRQMIEFAELTPDTLAVDLGSGDGRLVLAVVERGATCDGYEVVGRLVRQSRRSINQHQLENRAQIFHKSFWNADLSGYNIVFVFGMWHMMPRLETKLKKELKPGSRIITNHFTFPTLEPTKQKNGVYLYQMDMP